MADLSEILAPIEHQEELGSLPSSEESDFPTSGEEEDEEALPVSEAEMAPPTEAQRLAALEATDRTALQAERLGLAKYGVGTHAKDRHLKKCMDRIVPLRSSLESLVMTRVGKMPEGLEKNQALQEWLEYRDVLEDELELAETRYAAMRVAAGDPVVNNPQPTGRDAETLQFQLAVVEHAKTVEAECAAFTVQCEAITNRGQPLNRTQHAILSTRLHDMKTSIWPGFSRVTLPLLQHDPAQAGTHNAEMTRLVGKCTPLYHGACDVFAAMETGEDTFADASGNPVAGLSFAGGSGGAAGGQPGRLAMADYKYRGDPPDFYGDVSKYPAFKREWTTSVSLCRDDSWIIRNLALHVKVGDETVVAGILLCKTAKEAWDFLDNIYANPSVVAQHVIAHYQKTKAADFKVTTPQALLAAIETLTKQLYQKLETVDETEQLTNNMALIAHGMSLLPSRYSEEVADLLINKKLEKTQAGLKLKAPEMYVIWMGYMEKKVKQFRELQPSTLASSKSAFTPAKSSSAKQINAFQGGAMSDELPSPYADSDEDLHDFGQLSVNTAVASRTDGAAGGTASTKTEAEIWADIKSQWVKAGPCPVCNAEGHFWKGKNTARTPHFSDSMTDCSAFKKLGLQERIKFYKDLRLCRRCLSRGHVIRDCPRSTATFYCQNGKNDTPPNTCRQDHATLLHGAGILAGRASLKTNTWVGGLDPRGPDYLADLGSQDVMLGILAFRIAPGITVCGLLDNGSNFSLITHQLAAKLGLQGRKIYQLVELCGQAPTVMELTFYEVELILANESISIRLIGLDKITSNPGSFALTVAYQLFPHHKAPSLDKPDGDVEILIGADQVRFLPGGGHGRDRVDNLRVFSVPIPPYVVLMGSHPDISFTNPRLSTLAVNVRNATMCQPLNKDRLATSELIRRRQEKFNRTLSEASEDDACEVVPDKAQGPDPQPLIEAGLLLTVMLLYLLHRLIAPLRHLLQHPDCPAAQQDLGGWWDLLWQLIIFIAAATVLSRAVARALRPTPPPAVLPRGVSTRSAGRLSPHIRSGRGQPKHRPLPRCRALSSPAPKAGPPQSATTSQVNRPKNQSRRAGSGAHARRK